MAEALIRPTPRGAEGYQTVRGRVSILSGPSGVGKDSLTGKLKRQGFPLSYCITATTRRPRENEVDGVHYSFLDEPTFQRLREEDGLLEWAVVHDNNYGIPRWQVREGLQQGNDIMITVDVQGGETLRRKLPGAIFIFLAPPTLDELRPRLLGRGTETEAQPGQAAADRPTRDGILAALDYIVRNERDRLDEAVEAVKAIITAERLRVNPRLVSL